MGVVICEYPDESNPRELLSRLESIVFPYNLSVVEGDVYEEKLAKVEAMLESAVRDKEREPGWLSIKRDASSFGPMFRFSIEMADNIRVSGTLGRKSLSVICDDPIPVALLNHIAGFARTIRGATILAQDADGRPVPFEV